MNENGRINIKVLVAILVIIIAIISIVVVIQLNEEDDISHISPKEAYEYFTMYTADDKVGVIDRKGNIVIEPEYIAVFIPNHEKDVFICYIDEEHYSILNKDKEEQFKEYSNVDGIIISEENMEFEKYLLKYEIDGKYGLIDINGNKVTEVIYSEITSLKNRPGNILVKKDDLYGVFDERGNKIIDVKYNSIRSDEYSSEIDGYYTTGYIVSEKTKTGVFYGYIDYMGKVLVEPKYESITRFSEHDEIILSFMDSGKNGIIKGKKIIVNPKYQSITYYNTPEVFVVNKNGKFGVLDKKGDEILKTEYQECIVLGEYISVKNNEQMMLFDIHGNLVNTNTYKSIQPTENPYYFIAKDESDFYSIISKDVQIKDNYTNIRYAFDNFFIFTNQEGKSGVLEVYTGIELEPKYDFIILLENAKALEARTETTVDIYSNKIEKILSMENGIVEKVDDNYFVVYSNKDMKYINHNGEEVKNTEVFKDRKLYATQSPEGKWGFASNSGELKIEYKYDRVTELNEYGFAGVVKDGLWGVIDEEGKEIVPPTYNLDVYYEPKFVGKYLMEENEVLYCSEVTAQKVEASKKK